MPVPRTHAPPPRTLLRERVLDTLRAAIVDGTLEPGERLVAVALLRRMERVRFASLTGRESVARHRRIVELSGRGDAEGAAGAVRAHRLTPTP